MKDNLYSLILLALMFGNGPLTAQQSLQEKNKAVALKFYQDLWGNPTTEKYTETVADTYVVHDIGDRKGVTEPAVRQKEIADLFWENGKLDFELDYQVASGDLVATRWICTYKPTTFFGKFILRDTPLPIINVFRIRDGKIVEIWNHRHDIDTSQTDAYVLKGLGIGLLIALIPLILMIRYRRKLKRLS